MSLAFVPVMKQRTPPSMAGSHRLPISISEKEFLKNYVPFVDPIEARN
jgi:hypothetical protein